MPDFSLSPPQVIPIRERQALASGLTWQGHEFADAARNDTLWNKAKKTVLEKAGGVSVAVFTTYLQHLGKLAFGLPV